jgi:NAD(P)-dependent dehydrogenase (short-subunit alcohol dehydrogenase family)
MKTQDAVFFITGANRGLGLAFAREALKRGARRVYAGVRNPTDVDTPGVVQVRVDVTDPASVAAAARQCGDTTVLVNNAGIVRLTSGTLDPSLVGVAREIFETNYYGTVLVSQAFAPVLARNGGGAVVNVLSDATWFSRPVLAAYSPTKSAAWSFTNALRVDLRPQKTRVLALHVSFMDTDMTRGYEAKKADPRDVAAAALAGLEADEEEVLADDFTRAVKRSLGDEHPLYLRPPETD